MIIHVQPELSRIVEPCPKTVSGFDKCQPLPAGFGSIDPDDDFSAARFFTAARCNGWNPHVMRWNGKLSLTRRGFGPEKGRTQLQNRRYAALEAWSAAKDPDSILRWKYIDEIVNGLPSGDFFFLYL